MEAHWGYESKDRQEKEVTNRRNRYLKKTMKSTYGEIPINVPRDREGSFWHKLFLKGLPIYIGYRR